MGDFAKILYEGFFLRDLLGKIAPGGIVMMALFLTVPDVLKQALSVPDGIGWFFGLVLFAASLLLGLALQILGEFLGLLSAHPRPLWFRRTERGQEARRLFRARDALFPKKAEKSQKGVRERYVYLKEGSGNLAFAFFMLAGALYGHPLAAIILAIIAAVLYYTHVVHRTRQAYYEMNVLGLLPDAPTSPGIEKYTVEEIERYIGRDL